MHFWNKTIILPLALAFVVGLLSVAPFVLLESSIGSDYRGMPYFISDDEYTYATRMQEVLDGHWLVGSPFFFEYKYLPAAMPPIGEYFYAIPALIFRIPLLAVILISRFVFPAALFLLVFFLFKKMAGGEEVFSLNLSSSAAGLAVVLLYDQICLKYIFYGVPVFTASLWTRTVNPILGGLAVFIFLIFFWNALKGRGLAHKIVAGIVLGVSCFYFFSWGLILSILFVSGIMLALQKRWGELKTVGQILAAGAVASLPGIVLSLNSLIKGGHGSGEKLGMYLTHIPTLNITLLMAAGILAILWIFSAYLHRKLGNELWWEFTVWIILGSIWAFSQQVLTGRTVWPFHFVQYTKVLAIFVLLLAFYKILRPTLPKLWNVLMVLVCALALASGVAMARSYQKGESQFKAVQTFADPISWLNRNAPKDCVVLALEPKKVLVWQVTSFTKCNAYDSTWSFSGVPLDRVVHNYFVDMRLKGVTPQSVAAYMKENPGELRSVYFENWDQLFAKKFDAWLESKLDASAKEYADFFQKDFASEIRRYRLDYLILDRQLGQKEQDLLGLRTEPIRAGAFYIYPFN